MNFEIIKKLGIESEDLQEILDSLDEMQNDYIERMEFIDDEDERSETEAILNEITEQYNVVKKAIKDNNKKVSVLIPVAEENNSKKNIPIAVSEKQIQKEEKALLKENEKKQAEHEKALKQKADELRKVQEAQKKEDEKAGNKRIEEDKKKSEETANDSSTSASSAPSNGGLSPIDDALLEYKNKNYTAAFNKLNTAINTHTGPKDTDFASAEFILGKMCKDGSGIGGPDIQRAMFWFDNAAKHGNPDASVELGMIWSERQPKSAKEDQENVRNCLKYFKKAVDDSHGNPKYENSTAISAMNKYVSVCEQKIVSGSSIRQAAEYLDKLKDRENDSYIKTQIDNRKKALKKSIKARKSAAASNGGGSRTAKYGRFAGLNDLFILVGKIIMLAGFMYLSSGLLNDMIGSVDKVLWTFEKLPYKDGLVLLPELLSNRYFEAGLCEKGVFGIALVYIGCFINAFGSVEEQGSVSYVISAALMYMMAITIIMCSLTIVKFTNNYFFYAPQDLAQIHKNVPLGMLLVSLPGIIKRVLY